MTIADYGFAIWETFYVTVLSTAFSLVIGLPLGVLLVAGDKDGILPLPGWLMHLLNIIINILRSVPFLILMICVFPLTRIIVGTTVGTKATIVPLVVAAFPFVARLVETSLRELDEGVVEAAQSMGATPFQIITKVMIPECLPGLISSMTTALTTILGYSAMSGVIGGGGLGKIALSYGYYRYQTNIMIVCVILLVLLVQIFQTVGTFWATRSDKRLRKSKKYPRLLLNLSVAGFAATAPLVGEPLAKDSFFDLFAFGSQINFCRKAKHCVSRANRSEALTLENATECQGLPY